MLSFIFKDHSLKNIAQPNHFLFKSIRSCSQRRWPRSKIVLQDHLLKQGQIDRLYYLQIKMDKPNISKLPPELIIKILVYCDTASILEFAEKWFLVITKPFLRLSRMRNCGKKLWYHQIRSLLDTLEVTPQTWPLDSVMTLVHIGI